PTPARSWSPRPWWSHLPCVGPPLQHTEALPAGPLSSTLAAMSTPATAAPTPPPPRDGEASLADRLPSLLAALDVPGFTNPLGVEPLRRACLLVVDGLGWELLL